MSGYFIVNETTRVEFEKISMSDDGQIFWRELIVTDANGEKFGFTFFAYDSDSLNVFENIEFAKE